VPVPVPKDPALSICVCTCRRPAALARLVERLAAQAPPPIRELVVVDNDARGSGRAACAAVATPFALRYAIEPRRNIALARNRAVALATGDWLGFLDDDELPAPDWLAHLWRTARRWDADAVLGPVLAEPPADAPSWIRQGRFFERRRFRTGTPVPRNELRIGNALIRREPLAQLRGPFDAAYGLTGGEDGDMLCRLARHGARIVWCDEAVVVEPVERERLAPRWLLRRAWRGGNDYARHFLAGHYGRHGPARRAAFAIRAAAQALAALILALCALPLGRAHWLRRLRQAFANFGKLAALRGRRLEEYAPGRGAPGRTP
jgi:succinoglycan biosynthesis protein ExoM